jgi:L-galactose dehydrogenase
MDYRRLGRTDLFVSVLGYGASPLGGVFDDVDETDAVRSVRHSLASGVNFLDVSPYYGITRAETVLGRALAGVPRDDYVLATKVGRYGDAEFDYSEKRVRASVDESLRRLGVDHVDLIQCHDIEFVALDQVVEETIPALRSLVDEGKARYVGVTGYSLKALDYVSARAKVDTVLTYCRYNLQDQSFAQWSPVFAERDIGVINASVLAMGALTTRGAPAWHPASAELLEACARAAQLCRDRGSDIAKLALQYALRLPGVVSTLVGSARAENMARNIAWSESEIDTDLLRDLQRVLAPVRNVTWPVGRPENQDVSVEVREQMA